MTAVKGFSDLALSTRLRTVIRRIVREEIDAARPKYKYGQVVSVDSTARTAQVSFPEGGDALTAPYGTAVPVAGDYVRVSGLPGDRYIEDVVTLG